MALAARRLSAVRVPGAASHARAHRFAHTISIASARITLNRIYPRAHTVTSTVSCSYTCMCMHETSLVGWCVTCVARVASSRHAAHLLYRPPRALRHIAPSAAVHQPCPRRTSHRKICGRRLQTSWVRALQPRLKHMYTPLCTPLYTMSALIDLWSGVPELPEDDHLDGAELTLSEWFSELGGFRNELCEIQTSIEHLLGNLDLRMAMVSNQLGKRIAARAPKAAPKAAPTRHHPRQHPRHHPRQHPRHHLMQHPANPLKNAQGVERHRTSRVM